MRTLILASCFAVCMSAATITVPSLSDTLSGGEILGFTGGTLNAPKGNAALSMTASLDAATFGTPSITGPFFSSIVLTVNGIPITVNLTSHWDVSAGIGTWTFGLDRIRVLASDTTADGQAGFITIPSVVLSAPLGQSNTTQAFVGYSTVAPEPTTVAMLAIGIGAFAVVRKRYSA